MKKIINFLMLFLFVFIILSIVKAEELFSYIPYKSAEWKSKITITGKEEPAVIEQKIYYKKGIMRTESDIKNPSTGEKQRTVTIIDDKFIYSFDKNRKQGTKMSLSNKGPFNPEKQNIAMSKCRKSATKKGNEKINGIDCIIYEYKCLMNNEEFNIIEWRNKDGFPIKTISKYKDTVTTVEIVDLKINVSLSDSLFKPDSDIKFMDMEKVMGEKMKINTKDDIDKSSKEYGGNESETNDEDVDAGEMMKNMMKKYINK